MNKNCDPTELVVALLKRSQCAVQVAAVLSDGWGIHAWGWNHAGADGFGQHAEAHCLSRANPRRLAGSTLYVASRRSRNGRTINSRPCEGCQSLTKVVKRVIYRNSEGEWVEF